MVSINAKPLYCFVKQCDDRFYFFNENLEPLDAQNFNGLLAFVCYQSSVVVSHLAEYASRHQGLMALVTVFNQQRYSFFSQSIKCLLPQGRPIAGGCVWFDQGDVVLWHLKSGSISLDNPACHDNHPELANIIKQIGFPATKRLTLLQAEEFEMQYMRRFFLENGDYIDPAIMPKIVQSIVHEHQLESIIGLQHIV